MRVGAGDIRRIACNGNAFGQRTGIDISARGLGGDHQGDPIAHRFHGLCVGAGGLDRSADPAEQVDLPLEVHAAGESPLRRAATRLLGALSVAEFGTRGRLALGQPVGAGLAHHGTGAGEVGASHPQIGVGGKRLLDQAVERGVVVEPPTRRYFLR